jgi:uncharacterized membrane protein
MKMWRSRPETRIALAVVSLLVIHVAIIKQADAAAVITGLAYAGANLAIDWQAGASAGRRGIWFVAIGALSIALAAVLAGYASAVALLLAPSVVVNAALLALFGHTLLPGREPLITRFRRFEIGYVAPKFVRYTRLLTMLWTILFAFGTAVSLAAAVAGNIELWSWLAFVLLPALTVGFFLGEHAYRACRYGTEGRASPLRTLALILHPQAWLPRPAHEPQGDNARHG